MPDGRSITDAYRQAGTDFLAYRLQGMFQQLKTPEDIALHNVIQKEVFAMIGRDRDEANRFYRILAGLLIPDKARTRMAGKEFREMVAEAIFAKG